MYYNIKQSVKRGGKNYEIQETYTHRKGAASNSMGINFK